MIKRFDKKLREAALEDNLRLNLGLAPTAASWVALLGLDLAERTGDKLLTLRGAAQLTGLFTLLQTQGYDNILATLVEQNPPLASHLAALDTTTFGELRSAA